MGEADGEARQDLSPWSPPESTARGILAGRRARELLPYPVEEDIGTWAAREVTLADSEVYRRFVLDFSPWVSAVFDWFRDRRVDQIHLIQGSQTSKTLAMLLCLFWAGRFRPGRAFWIGATQEEAQDFATERLKAMLEESGARPLKKADWLKRTLLVGALQLRIVWASSARKLRGWPVRYIFGDETGIWPRSLPEVGEPMEYAWKRTRMFAGRGRKAVFGTTPRDTQSAAWRKAVAAEFHQWWVPCPHCGKHQYLAWDRVKFGHCRRADRSWDEEKIKAETFYECLKCGTAIDEGDKLAMVRAGRMQAVDPETGAALEPGRDPREVALQIPATYSVFTRWSELALGFLKSKREGPEALRIFITDELAQPWQEEGEKLEETAVTACVDEERHPGEIPADTLAITAGVDAQTDRMYYIIRAWLPGDRSALIRHGVVARDAADRGLGYLDEVLLGDVDGRMIDMTFIDSGFEPDFVYDYCARSNLPRAPWGRRIAPSKGRGLKLNQTGAVRGSTQLAPVIAYPLASGKAAAKRRLPGDMLLYLINTDWAKQWLLGHIACKRGDPGEWRLHSEVDEDYLAQLGNEERVRRKDQFVWRARNASLGSHYLDCEVLARAAAWFPVGVHRLRPRRKEGEPARAAEITTKREPWRIGR